MLRLMWVQDYPFECENSNEAEVSSLRQSATMTMRKTAQFIFRASRKLVSQPGEALLLCRMAWWVSVLSVAARCFSLPRALAIVAGGETSTTRADDAETQKRLARTIDLLLSADILHLKPICWKRAAVLHRLSFAERNTNSNHLWRAQRSRRQSCGTCVARSRRPTDSRKHTARIRRHLSLSFQRAIRLRGYCC